MFAQRSAQDLFITIKSKNKFPHRTLSYRVKTIAKAKAATSATKLLRMAGAADVAATPQQGRLYVTPLAFAATSNTDPASGKPML